MKIVEPEIKETGTRKIIFEIDYCERRIAKLEKGLQRRGRPLLTIDEAIELLEDAARAERLRA
jgi:hypothetical protein